MALIRCPDCAREHSDLAEACPQCGRPAERPRARSNYVCPKCGSENTQLVSLVHEGQTKSATSRTSGSGLNYSGHDIGAIAGTARTTTNSRTMLGSRAAPPDKRPLTGPGATLGLSFFAALLIGGFVGIIGPDTAALAVGLIVGLGAAAVTMYENRVNRRYNNFEWPDLYRRWQRLFLCHRCGEQFEPLGHKAAS